MSGSNGTIPSRGLTRTGTQHCVRTIWTIRHRLADGYRSHVSRAVRMETARTLEWIRDRIRSRREDADGLEKV